MRTLANETQDEATCFRSGAEAHRGSYASLNSATRNSQCQGLNTEKANVTGDVTYGGNLRASRSQSALCVAEGGLLEEDLRSLCSLLHPICFARLLPRVELPRKTAKGWSERSVLKERSKKDGGSEGLHGSTLDVEWLVRPTRFLDCTTLEGKFNCVAGSWSAPTGHWCVRRREGILSVQYRSGGSKRCAICAINESVLHLAAKRHFC